jgi:hypothetical protein
MRFRVFILVFSLMAVLILPARETGGHARYIGGTLAEIPLKTEGILQTTDDTYFVFVSKKTQVRIPYERINLLEYGQDVDHRYISAALISPLFLLVKKREHFLTIGYQDNDGRQQALLFRVAKEDIRLALATLEARTGQQVQYQDDEARMAGKG